MLNYLIKRLFYSVLVLFGVCTLVFFLFNILPGDPARMMLGQRSDISTVESIKKELGLDQPLLAQYAGFMNDLSPLAVYRQSVSDDYWALDSSKFSFVTITSLWNNWKLVLKKPYLRRSYQSKRLVTDILAEAVPKTMLLAATSMILAMIAGVFIGIICAIFRDSWFDKSAQFFSVLGMSLPSFFAAVLIAYVFAFLLGEYTGLNMYGSMYTVDDLGEGDFIDLRNLILPAVTLGIRPLAIVIQLTRGSMLDVLTQDYIRTAFAKGLSFQTIIRKHALKNAMNPVLTAVTGWFASLMAGAVFVEYVFDWKGIGVVIVDSLEKYDFPVVMGAVLFISVILIIINIFVDLLYAFLDPRVRYS